MKLKRAEKHFWWNFGQITDSRDIPTELSGFTSFDDDVDDDYLAMLIDKVKVIHKIFLKETRVTDKGLQLISSLQGLRVLVLMKHDHISPASLPHLNKLTDLEYLEIWKTKISLTDIKALSQLKKLKELYISSSETDSERILEQVIELNDILPACKIYVNYDAY